MTQDMNKQILRREMEKTYSIEKQKAAGVPPRVVTRRCTRLVRTLLFLMAMTLGATAAWGQEGIWYIANDKALEGESFTYNNSQPADRYYLVPAKNPEQPDSCDAYFSTNYSEHDGNPETPYLTTYKTIQDSASVWVIKSADNSNSQYFLIHVMTGKYAVYNTTPDCTSKKHRKVIHLETLTDPDNDSRAKFYIENNNNNTTFRPQSLNNGHRYFNPSGGNKDNYNAQGGDCNNTGLIGVYEKADANNRGSLWHLESALLAAPTISDVSPSTGRVTITENNGLPAGYKIRYTTDGSDPTKNSTIMDASGFEVITPCTLKVVIERYGVLLTEVMEKSVEPVPCATPVISYDYITQLVSITCATTGATIHYTTNGSDPTDEDPEYNSQPFTVTPQTTIKAIATHTVLDDSGIGELTITQVATPTIQNNGSNAISITSATPDATIYYTTDGSTPTTSNSEYTTPLQENVSGVTIKAIAVKENMITSEMGSGAVTLQCEEPVIFRSSNTRFTITCPFPASGVTIYYTTDGSTPTTSSSSTTPGSTISCTLPITVSAFAVATGYNNSSTATVTLNEGMGGEGTAADPYTIEFQNDVNNFIVNANTAAGASKHYKVIATDSLDFSGVAAITQPFSGTFDGGLCILKGLTHALFNKVNGGTVKNVILKGVDIQSGDVDGDAGAICNKTEGASVIYNCGILPTTTNRDVDGNITGFTGSSVTGSRNVGSLVGLLDGTSRVINCYSYANINGASGTSGGIVGNNAQTSTMSDIKTIVVNCIFYGESTGYPVYGGNVIENSGATAINNYNYYRESASFDDNFSLAKYNRSWPAEERYLTRFEYYRSILNSNKKLCTWWVNGTSETAPTDNDIAEVGVAKWVLDPSIAPYPILKKWGKYPSIINPDSTQTWDREANNGAGAWQQRSTAAPYRGKSHGTLTVTVSTGNYPGTLSGLSTKTKTVYPVITEMDTLNCDYGYYKIQLPYYNEVFGDPEETNYLRRYWGNYTTKVVTGWIIKTVDESGTNSFKKAWEDGYNYADRYCTAKDIYDDNDHRAFAQGGYYYVPEGVTEIEIEAYWGKAFYLHGKDHALDRVSVTTYDATDKNYGYAFTPAGTLNDKMPYNDISIYDDFKTLMTEVKKEKNCNVYDQAVVLVGNYPLQARNDIGMGNSCKGGFTIMSADFDMDNEPDFCFPLQWRGDVKRHPIMPIRFDFLPVPELGMAMRHNTNAYAIGIFVPEGHFEITETSFMHTTQFEYMSVQVNHTNSQPLILNGGQFEQIVAHGNKETNVPTNEKTRNIILGGHVWMKRFSPGSHTEHHCFTRHCAVSVMGGEFPEFYLTGIYWTGVDTLNAYNDSPHCYTNGGRFGIMAGAGMEAVKNNVHFKIDHSVIDEFYGGGINSNNPVAGNISVTINNSLVLEKYCGGPKVGTSDSVTTNAKGTIFNYYYGGGNGGTNLYREQIKDQTPTSMPGTNDWNGTYGFTAFKPISDQGSTVTSDSDKGYHAEFEFEVFNQSNGLGNDAVARTYYHWAQFGTTTTGDVTNILEDCTVNHNFYGGGNLATVNGTATSTLKGTTQVIGSAFGAGYSASVPQFPVHTKTGVSYPYRDGAGVCHNGSLQYLKDGTEIRQYTWCYKNPETNVVTPAGVVIPEGVGTSAPAFKYNNKWYCYTTVSLENLGTVSSKATINIEGSALVKGMEFDDNGVVTETQSGGVFGGGDASAALGDTEVNVNATSQQTAGYNAFNVFGGGNNAAVGGNTVVNLKNGIIENHTFGGGNEGAVEGSATVNIEE